MITDLIISNLLGLLVGLIASFLSWWVLFRLLVPTIGFSNAISKVRRRNGEGNKYRVKIQNTGSRAVIGVEIFARLYIKRENGNNWSGLYVPLGSSGEAKYEVPHLGKGGNRVLTLFINRVETFRKKSAGYPDVFVQKASQHSLTMEDVLSLGRDANLQVFLSGYDEFSGARKVFASEPYRTKDIKAGWFRGLQVDEKQSEIAESTESMGAETTDELVMPPIDDAADINPESQFDPKP